MPKSHLESAFTSTTFSAWSYTPEYQSVHLHWPQSCVFTLGMPSFVGSQSMSGPGSQLSRFPRSDPLLLPYVVFDKREVLGITITWECLIEPIGPRKDIGPKNVKVTQMLG